jgi:hypothetical protein
MGDTFRPKPNISEVCPCGILNLAAALEAYTLLMLAGTDDVHKRLREWLAENYLDGNINLLNLDEPLGRRIRSIEDLGMLVSAYGRARSLRRPKTHQMKNELYFYGQKPERDAAVAAAKFMQQYFKPDAATGRITTVNEPLPAEKGVKWAEPLASVKEMSGDEPVAVTKRTRWDDPFTPVKKTKGKERLDSVQEVSEEVEDMDIS